jgi:hypothetical protein
MRWPSSAASSSSMSSASTGLSVSRWRGTSRSEAATWKWDFNRALKIHRDFKRALENSTGHLKSNRDFNRALKTQQGFQQGT